MKLPKIDLTTSMQFLPMLTHRGVFSGNGNLPTKEDILSNEKKRLGVSSLTPEYERELLESVSHYYSNGKIVRDFGSYVIAFSAKLYIEELEKAEKQIKDELLRDEYTKEEIEKALTKLNTYKLAQRMAVIILAEVSEQRKCTGLVIPRHRLVERLGFTSRDKHIYNQIKDAMFSLRWIDYAIYEFNTKKEFSEKGITTGTFIYNIRETPTAYTLWVNEVFVGSVAAMFTDNNNKKDFARGYIEYPMQFIKEAKNMSDSASFLGQYLFTQTGNPKIKKVTKKRVVAQSVEKLMHEAKITHSRPNERVIRFLDALTELKFIEKIDPSIKEMRNMKSSTVEKLNLHLTLPDKNSDIEKVLITMQK